MKPLKKKILITLLILAIIIAIPPIFELNLFSDYLFFDQHGEVGAGDDTPTTSDSQNIWILFTVVIVAIVTPLVIIFVKYKLC